MMQLIGQFFAFLGVMAANDPIVAAILVVALVIVPSLMSFDAFWRLYWLGWWSTAVALGISAHRHEPLGLGGALSRSAVALLAKPKGQQVVVTQFAAAGGEGSARPTTPEAQPPAPPEGGTVTTCPADKQANGSPAETPETGQAPAQPADAPRGTAAVDAFREKMRAVADAFKDAPRGGDALAPGGTSIVWAGARVTDADRRASELQKLRGLEHVIAERVRGQEHVTRGIAQHLIRRMAGVHDAKAARRPVLSALFVGPTGTGKTELAKALADALERKLITYDMPNYATSHTVSGLIGSPAGYVGSDKPGRLVTDVNAHPTAVFLFDEIEKADGALFDPFLSLLDEGRLKDLGGNAADASQTLIILTSNLLGREAAQEFTEDQAEVRRMVLDAAGAPKGGAAGGFGLRPEFVNRIDLVLMFKPLSRDVLDGIARKYILSFIDQVAAQQGLRLQARLDETVLDAVLAKCDLKFGARDLHRAVADLLGNALVDGYVPCLEKGVKPTQLWVAAEGGKIVATYS